MTDHPTIDIEEIAMTLKRVGWTAEPLPEGGLYNWNAVAREHLRRVREVVERMPCACLFKNRFSSGGNVIRVVEARCSRCEEGAAIDAALADGEQT